MTSGCCLRSPERATHQGFTLLELVVVMALMALAAGLVAPAALRGLAAAQERGIASDMSAVLASLPVRAFQRGEALTVEATSLRQLVPGLPEDWGLVVAEPLRYNASGVGSGGRVRLLPPGRAALEWDVAVFSGEVARAATPADR